MATSKALTHAWQATALRVALAYVVFAGLWITFSDLLLLKLGLSAQELSRWQTAKGWLFVLITGGLLFAYLSRCLRRQHETFTELTTLFDSIPAIVYAADMQTFQLLFVNRFAIDHFGSQWRGMKCFEYLQQGEQDACNFCTNPQLLRNGQPGQPVIWEFRNTKNGHWYQCLDKAVRWPDGRLVRLEIALDITERKEMERTKEELLSAVSHEMRTPLTAITGFSELLLDDPSLNDTSRKHIETIFRESEKMQELIQTFLEVRRLKTDQARIDYENLPVIKLLEQSSANSECTSNHQVMIECPPDLTIYGNRRELTQVFKQLLSNACRFSPQGGSIFIDSRPADENAQICISDQGIGIPEEELERIFEPFHRIDIGDRRRVRGIGLGLAMVREVVNLHGGTVRAESIQGKGSRFTVTLPRVLPIQQTPKPQ